MSEREVTLTITRAELMRQLGGETVAPKRGEPSGCNPAARSVSFTVPGNPIGYYAMGKHPNWTRMKEYHAYKARVQMFAAQAGIRLPLQVSKQHMLIIATAAWFATGVHCDPGNVQKGVVDALFYKSDSGDKYTGGAFAPPMYDKQNPRVLVTIHTATGKDFLLSVK